MNTFVFGNASSLKRKKYLADIMGYFNLKIMGQRSDVTLLENKDMLVDIDNRWISIIVLKSENEDKVIHEIKEFFYTKRK